MTLKRSLSFLFASFALLGLSQHAHGSARCRSDRMGNGIAAIAEGEIITIEQLRRELEPIIPRLRAEARSEKEFSESINRMSREVLQT